MLINIIEYLEKKTLQQCSDKTAVIDGERIFNFRELVKLSKNLANRIVDFNDSINRPVVVFLPKSAETIIADIAVIYSGNIYTNLDIKTPPRRIINILNSINPHLIITNNVFVNNVLDMGIDL